MSKHKKKKTRLDVAEIARMNLEQIIGEKLSGKPLDQIEKSAPDTQNKSAGRMGGLKGGRARANKLSTGDSRD